MFLKVDLYAGAQSIISDINIEPEPKQITFSEELIVLDGAWRVVVEDELLNIAQILSQKINEKFKVNIPVEKFSPGMQGKNIVLSLIQNDSWLEKNGVFSDADQVVIGQQGYILTVSAGKIAIFANTDRGVFYGVQSLLQLFNENNSRLCVPGVTVIDYPDTSVRGIHLCGLDYNTIYKQIDRLAELKINMLIFGAWDFFYLDDFKKKMQMEKVFQYARERYIEPVPEIPGYSHVIPLLERNPNCAEGRWIKDEKYRFKNNIAEAEPDNKYDLNNVLISDSSSVVLISEVTGQIFEPGIDYEIIPAELSYPYREDNPEIKIKRLVGSRIKDKEVVFVEYNCVPEDCEWIPYCPSEKATYEIMFSTIDRVIELLKPKYINIAHDEIMGINADSRCRKRGLSNAQLLAEDINKIYAYIKMKDSSIKVMMWDDMLNPWHNGGNENLHLVAGGKKGGTAQAIKMISKEISILLWWYEGNDRLEKLSKSPAFFADYGFEFFVCPWKNKKNINEWAEISQKEDMCAGIIGTAWEGWDKNLSSIIYVAKKAWRN